MDPGQCARAFEIFQAEQRPLRLSEARDRGGVHGHTLDEALRLWVFGACITETPLIRDRLAVVLGYASPPIVVIAETSFIHQRGTEHVGLADGEVMNIACD